MRNVDYVPVVGHNKTHLSDTMIPGPSVHSISEIHDLCLLDDPIETFDELPMRRVFPNIVVAILLACEFDDECVRHAVLWVGQKPISRDSWKFRMVSWIGNFENGDVKLNA